MNEIGKTGEIFFTWLDKIKCRTQFYLISRVVFIVNRFWLDSTKLYRVLPSFLSDLTRISLFLMLLSELYQGLPRPQGLGPILNSANGAALVRRRHHSVDSSSGPFRAAFSWEWMAVRGNFRRTRGRGVLSTATNSAGRNGRRCALSPCVF